MRLSLATFAGAWRNLDPETMRPEAKAVWRRDGADPDQPGVTDQLVDRKQGEPLVEKRQGRRRA